MTTNPSNFPTLSVSGLSLARGDSLILSDLTFQVKGGEALHVLGENGAGKSTLLQALAGLLPLASGKIERGDNALSFLGHDNGLLPDLTVAENLQVYEDSGLRCDDDVLERLGIADFLNKPAKALSFGQARRVALALACRASLPIWLLDEPFAGLDKASVAALKTLLETHLGQDGLIVFSSHDQGLEQAQILELKIAHV